MALKALFAVRVWPSFTGKALIPQLSAFAIIHCLPEVLENPSALFPCFLLLAFFCFALCIETVSRLIKGVEKDVWFVRVMGLELRRATATSASDQVLL